MEGMTREMVQQAFTDLCCRMGQAVFNKEMSAVEGKEKDVRKMDRLMVQLTVEYHQLMGKANLIEELLKKEEAKKKEEAEKKEASKIIARDPK